MWIFRQRTGEFLHNDRSVATGYSGFREGKNTPLAQHLPGVGPIPQGAYAICPEIESEEHGPVAMHLIPLTGTETYGRSAFMIHGDSKDHPGEASHGCIILPRPVREQIAAGRDRLLIVLSGNPTETA